MEFLGAILAIVVAGVAIGFVLLDRGKSVEVKEGIKPSKEEEIQVLMKEIERLRNYAYLLEERLEEEEVEAAVVA